MTTKHNATAATVARQVSAILAGARHDQHSTERPKTSTGRPIYLNGARCGQVLGSVFERRYNTQAHVLRRINALSFHRSVIDQLTGVEWIRAIDETGRESWCTLAELLRYGIPVNDPRHGAQLALSLTLFTPRPERQSRLL